MAIMTTDKLLTKDQCKKHEKPITLTNVRSFVVLRSKIEVRDLETKLAGGQTKV